jgi:hypothetical protein
VRYLSWRRTAFAETEWRSQSSRPRRSCAPSASRYRARRSLVTKPEVVPGNPPSLPTDQSLEEVGMLRRHRVDFCACPQTS